MITLSARHFDFAGTRLGRLLIGACRRQREAARRRRALRDIRSLSPHTLKDIAIDRSEALSIVYGSPKDRRRRSVQAPES